MLEPLQAYQQRPQGASPGASRRKAGPPPSPLAAGQCWWRRAGEEWAVKRARDERLRAEGLLGKGRAGEQVKTKCQASPRVSPRASASRCGGALPTDWWLLLADLRAFWSAESAKARLCRRCTSPAEPNQRHAASTCSTAGWRNAPSLPPMNWD